MTPRKSQPYPPSLLSLDMKPPPGAAPLIHSDPRPRPLPDDLRQPQAAAAAAVNTKYPLLQTPHSRLPPAVPRNDPPQPALPATKKNMLATGAPKSANRPYFGRRGGNKSRGGFQKREGGFQWYSQQLNFENYPEHQGRDYEVSSGSNSGPVQKIPQLNVDNLLSQLLAAGVIHSNAPAAKKVTYSLCVKYR